jgi:hypothetical protein
MAVSPALIRSTLRTHLEGAAQGWTELAGVPEMLGMDPRTLLHLGYSVAVPSSTTITPDRQARGGIHRGAVVSTDIVVRWSYRLPVDDQRAGYDAALQAEQDLCRLVLSVPGEDQILLRWTGASRAPTGDGSHLTGQLEFVCLHTYDLTAE